MMPVQKRYILTLLAGLVLFAGTFLAQPPASGSAVSAASTCSSVKSLSAVPYGPDASLARGKFLVADRGIGDSLFSQAVILLVSYGQNGAMGLIINHPTNVELSSALPGIKGMKSRGNKVFIGGPVGIDEMFLLVRSADKPDKSLHVFGDVYMSMSRETLEAIVSKEGRGENFRVYAGYAGWAPGQLEREVSRGDWHVVSADAKTVFEKKPDAIWQELIERASAQWVKLRNSIVRFL